MKYLFTMNMPSGQANLVHQVTGDIAVESCYELIKLLNSTDFIVVRQYYRPTDKDGQKFWVDRGDIALNVQHIGKVQEYNESYTHDASGNFGRGRSHSEAEGATVWRR